MGKSRCLWHRDRALGLRPKPPTLFSLRPEAAESVSPSQFPPRPHGRSGQWVFAHSGNSRFCMGPRGDSDKPNAPLGFPMCRHGLTSSSPTVRSRAFFCHLVQRPPRDFRGISLSAARPSASRPVFHGSLVGPCPTRQSGPCATDPRADEQVRSRFKLAPVHNLCLLRRPGFIGHLRCRCAPFPRASKQVDQALGCKGFICPECK